MKASKNKKSFPKKKKRPEWVEEKLRLRKAEEAMIDLGWIKHKTIGL